MVSASSHKIWRGFKLLLELHHFPCVQPLLDLHHFPCVQPLLDLHNFPCAEPLLDLHHFPCAEPLLDLHHYTCTIDHANVEVRLLLVELGPCHKELAEKSQTWEPQHFCKVTPYNK